MGIPRGFTITVSNFNQVAVGTAPAGIGDDPISCCKDRCSGVVGDINAFVHPTPTPSITRGENTLRWPLITHDRWFEAVGLIRHREKRVLRPSSTSTPKRTNSKKGLAGRSLGNLKFPTNRQSTEFKPWIPGLELLLGNAVALEEGSQGITLLDFRKGADRWRGGHWKRLTLTAPLE